MQLLHRRRVRADVLKSIEVEAQAVHRSAGLEEHWPGTDGLVVALALESMVGAVLSVKEPVGIDVRGDELVAGSILVTSDLNRSTPDSQ